MKKTFVALLTIFSFAVLAVSATDTISTKSTSSVKTKPKLEKIGTPKTDSNLSGKQTPPKGAPKNGQKPRKKPNAKPGGDKVPPELMKTK